jgi:hypothetical protein
MIQEAASSAQLAWMDTDSPTSSISNSVTVLHMPACCITRPTGHTNAAVSLSYWIEIQRQVNQGNRFVLICVIRRQKLHQVADFLRFSSVLGGAFHGLDSVAGFHGLWKKPNGCESSTIR